MMSKSRLPTLLGAILVVGAFAVRASAAEPAPDPNTQREFGAKLQVCGACHGANGVPKSPAIPVIWGQQENYLEKQIHDFRIKARNAEVMNWMSDTFDDAEVRPAAAFLGAKTWPAKARPAAAMAAPAGIAVCAACHQANFMGAAQAEGVATPRLAGQNYDYLVESMRRFAEGERTNNGDMVQIMKALSPAQRDVMARYLSAL